MMTCEVYRGGVDEGAIGRPGAVRCAWKRDGVG